MGKYKPYPEYKDSGVEWLGDVPKGWVAKKLKHVVMSPLQYGANASGVPYSSDLPRYIRITDFDESGQLNEKSKLSLAIDNYREYRVEDGNILFARSGATVGKVFQCKGLKESSCFAGYLIKAIPDEHKVLSDFLYQYTQSYEYGHWKSLTLNKATIENIGADKYSQLNIFTPPLEEQAQIAAFLDHETAKIDRLIEKQEKLIELLKEKRQAVISHAVTKGLNPDAPMKDSGVEWLGDVPEGYILKRLKHVSPKVSVGLVVNPSTYTQDEGVPFLFGGDISENKINTDSCRRISYENSCALKASQLHAGDLVCVRVGYPGVTAVVPEQLDGANCASMMIIRAGSFASNWLCYAMNSHIGKQQVEVVQYGAAQKQYNIADAVDFVFPVPSYEEQIQIAAFLDCETAKIGRLIGKQEKLVSLLRERRTALISAAVTGRIDVRDWSEN